MSINIPGHCLETLLEIPGAAALRVFLVICSAAQDGLARISASELSLRARLTSRSVFDALGQLEERNCIVRESRSPGPQSNGIRVVELPMQDTSQDGGICNGAQCHSTPADQCGNAVQDASPDIQRLLASCFRILSDAELRRTEQFVVEHLAGDLHRFARAVAQVEKAGGVAPDSSLELCLGIVGSHLPAQDH